MSLLEELAARLRATADELPLDMVAVAAERLRTAGDLLMWVRQESVDPMGVPQLTNATEHLEQAGHALRVGQDAVGEYLATIGIGYDAAAPPDRAWRGALGETPPPRRADAGDETPPPTALRRWWADRVDELADHPRGADRAAGEQAARQQEADRREAATAGPDLLRRVARHVRGDDRDRLRRELGRVEAPVGLGLAALSPPVLRHLAAELLGHEPGRVDGPADLERLTRETQSRVRQLLPRMPDEVVTTLLARVCRTPPPKPPEKPPHPTDPAVAGAVLTGVLLQRLGRDPDSLDPAAAEPPASGGGQTSGRGAHG